MRLCAEHGHWRARFAGRVWGDEHGRESRCRGNYRNRPGPEQNDRPRLAGVLDHVRRHPRRRPGMLVIPQSQSYRRRTRMRTITALFAALIFAAPAVAQKPPKLPSGDEMVETYLKLRVAKLSTHFLGGASTKEEWEAKRPKMKEQYFEMLGLAPLPENTPLHATITGTLERGDIII